jgi:catechol 2,3-dioxygenase-like lactoylglutathione lyase family enzyme
MAMFKDTPAFSGYAVKDLDQAKEFYGKTLGLEVRDQNNCMGLDVKLATGAHVSLYPKEDHVPATYTVLNFPVDNLEEAMTKLEGAGIKFEQYHDDRIPQDERGISHGNADEGTPDIAWFKDPSGNILSVLHEN